MSVARTFGLIVLLTIVSVVAFVVLHLAIAYLAIFVVELAEPWPRGAEWSLFSAAIPMIAPWYACLYLLGLLMAWPFVARFSARRGIWHVLACASASAAMHIAINLPSNKWPFLYLLMPVAVVVIVFFAAVILAPRAAAG